METEANRRLELTLTLAAYGGYLTVISEKLVLIGMEFSLLGDRLRRGSICDIGRTGQFYEELRGIRQGLESVMRSRRRLSPFPHLLKKTLRDYALRYDIFIRDMRYFSDSITGEEAERWRGLIDRFEELAKH